MTTRKIVGALAMALCTITAGLASPAAAYQGSTYEQLIEDDALTDQHAIVIRFYAAVFGRTPDNDGVRFWLDQYDTGEWSTRRIADFFATSDEFASLYGEGTSNAQFVDSVYPNVLGRTPDEEGRTFWIDYLDNGNPRAEMILLMSNAPEFVEANRLPFELDPAPPQGPTEPAPTPDPIACDAVNSARVYYPDGLVDFDGVWHQPLRFDFDLENTGTEDCGAGWTPLATHMTMTPGHFDGEIGHAAPPASHWSPIGLPDTVWVPLDDTQWGGLLSTVAYPLNLLQRDFDIAVETEAGHVVTFSDVVVDIETDTRTVTGTYDEFIGDTNQGLSTSPSIRCVNTDPLEVTLTLTLEGPYAGQYLAEIDLPSPSPQNARSTLWSGCFNRSGWSDGGWPMGQLRAGGETVAIFQSRYAEPLNVLPLDFAPGAVERWEFVWTGTNTNAETIYPNVVVVLAQ